MAGFICIGIFSLILFVKGMADNAIDTSIKQAVTLKLSIPWPSGIMIDKALGHTVVSQDGDTYQEVFRVGRNQFNSVKMRTAWSSTHVFEKVLTPSQCTSIINRAESYATKYGWSRGRHVDYDSDLPVKSIYILNQNYTADNAVSENQPGEAYSRLMNRLNKKVTKKIASQYGLDFNNLKIDDLFLTKYDASIPPKHMLGPHQDKSMWSFVVSLNDDFDGGGTYFFDNSELWKPPLGSALAFCGQRLHGGSPITSGARYILAGFVDSLNPLSHDDFMKLYDPIYDGYAAQSGFRSGDIIIGIEICENLMESAVETTGDIISPPTIIRRMISITPNTTDEEWSSAATSCELLAPSEPTVLLIRRFETVYEMD